MPVDMDTQTLLRWALRTPSCVLSCPSPRLARAQAPDSYFQLDDINAISPSKTCGQYQTTSDCISATGSKVASRKSSAAQVGRLSFSISVSPPPSPLSGHRFINASASAPFPCCDLRTAPSFFFFLLLLLLPLLLLLV